LSFSDPGSEPGKFRITCPNNSVQCREDRPHFYFLQTPKSKACGNNDLGGVFEFKQWHRYVIAEGSVRRAEPDAGLTYTVIDPSPIIPIPDWIVDKLPKKLKVAATPGEKVGHGGRHEYLTGVAGKLRNSGMDRDALEAALIPINDSMLTEPLPLSDLAHIAASVSRYPVPEPEPPLIIAGTRAPKPVVRVEEKVVTDWRQHFHTKDEALNAPPITFLIQDFLQCEGVTAIAAPVRERKSLIALNVTHSLLTGEKLFDHFEVVKKPARVLYLCPEVSLGPFTDRVRKIGLLDYVGDRFFYRTMSAEGHLALNDTALRDALPGSVVILDTAIRFLEGDENSSAHIRVFADSIFALLRNGTEAVVLLHHSPKDMGDTMTLETAMRGSGDMGAFLASCWGTRLQDPTKPYESASFLSNLKQRDFESQDFEVTCQPDCLMRIVGNPALTVMAPRKNRANKDGLESKAMELLRANPKMSVRDTVSALKAAGIRRGKTWVTDKRYELMQVPEVSAVR
jgi:AAA domain/Primase C terminal 1 (PriCT-1)